MRAIKPLLPANLQVKDSAKQAKDDAKKLNDGMAMIRWVLLGFGAIALLVGAFVIFNTLSITVAQRTREFATLRTLGASRKQVMRSVRLEGLVIGLRRLGDRPRLGSRHRQGHDRAVQRARASICPTAGTVIATQTITISLIVGTGVTLLASILPAKRATRVPPIAAVREGAVLPSSRFASAFGQGGSRRAARVARRDHRVAMFANGVSGALIAVLLVPRRARPVRGHRAAGAASGQAARPRGRLAGASRRGVAGELAGANAVRNPGRTASTAAALMIGLTLVTVVAVLGAGINAGTKSAVSKQVHADYVIDGSGRPAVPGLRGRRARGDPGRHGGVAASARTTPIVQGKQLTISGIDPATIARFYTFNWTTGSDARSGVSAPTARSSRRRTPRPTT